MKERFDKLSCAKIVVTQNPQHNLDNSYMKERFDKLSCAKIVVTQNP
ncbi:hypothetical protein IBE76_10575, partial [Francisella tularensis]|nr:hypothetical protein [Francisella tularensis]